MPAAHTFAPHYTIDDYQHWKGDWELWDGVAIAMSPSPLGRHQRLASRLVQLLANAIDESNCDAVAIAELDWIVRNDTVVRPDVGDRGVMAGGTIRARTKSFRLRSSSLLQQLSQAYLRR